MLKGPDWLAPLQVCVAQGAGLAGFLQTAIQLPPYVGTDVLFCDLSLSKCLEGTVLSAQ